MSGLIAGVGGGLPSAYWKLWLASAGRLVITDRAIEAAELAAEAAAAQSAAESPGQSSGQ